MRFVLLLALLALVGCTAPAKPRGPLDFKPRTDGDPVAASIKVDRTKIRAGDTFPVSIILDVACGFEIQDRHAPPPAIATMVELSLPAGFHEVGDWSTPQTVRSQWPDGHAAYAGVARFERQVRVDENVKPAEYLIGCAIRYQACNDRYCLRPTDVRLAAGVRVRR